MSEALQHIKINLPENITSEHEQYFEQCLEWEYHKPGITAHFFSLVYSKGYSTNLFLQPLKNMSPWPTFYEKFNKSFFLGRVLNAVKKNETEGCN